MRIDDEIVAATSQLTHHIAVLTHRSCVSKCSRKRKNRAQNLALDHCSVIHLIEVYTHSRHRIGSKGEHREGVSIGRMVGDHEGVMSDVGEAS